MPLVPTQELLAVTPLATGAFNTVLLGQLEAILAGATRAGLPVIVQISENAVAYRGPSPRWPPRRVPRSGPPGYRWSSTSTTPPGRTSSRRPWRAASPR